MLAGLMIFWNLLCLRNVQFREYALVWKLHLLVQELEKTPSFGERGLTLCPRLGKGFARLPLRPEG